MGEGTSSMMRGTSFKSNSILGVCFRAGTSTDRNTAPH